VNALIESNRVEDNTHAGIFHEISYAATIRDNVVRRNGHGHRQWAYGAGILVAHSPGVKVYGNTLDGNWNGIMGIQQNRGSGAFGAYELRDLDVHDNTIIMGPSPRDASGNGAWAAGVASDAGTAVYSRNNRFTGNDYTVPVAGSWWTWANGRRTWAQWQSYGHDLTGTLT
jgi:parallel beta-helix repeat protein